MAEPKLTVCVPVYNGEKTIGRLLKSLTAQTMDDIRILVSDNASTDETGRICRNLASRDSRIIYSCNPENLGLNFNFCHVSFAHNSPYTAYAAHDLIWKPQFAEKLILVLENNPDALIAYPCCEFIDSDRETEELYFDKVRFDEPDPETRYLNVIKYLGWNTPFLGIMRHFKASPLWLQILYAYNEDFSGDNLHIAAIALMGKIKQLHLPLLQRKKGEH
ncbi:MAG: glycosyltransferase family 2 protein, partial [Deltaproteobacteria bacterium]|nr:glycosyltransferase family 2 protein [Deltaproteobacteria bacterium]